MADDLFQLVSPPSLRRTRVRSVLPGMTFAELRSLMQGGAVPPGQVRRRQAGYVVEFEVGPRRCLLVGTRSRRPRVFQSVDAALKALQSLSSEPLVVRLDPGRVPTNGQLEFDP